MKLLTNRIKSATNRRSFIKKTLTAVGTAGVGAGLLSSSKNAFGKNHTSSARAMQQFSGF
jgi:hypothetical protein